MPVRLLRPTLRTSERWHRSSYFDRCLYISLLNLVDDFGRYDANPTLLASECFPYGDEHGLPMTASAIDGGLRSLASKDLLAVYRKDGKMFLQLSRWDERVRQKTSKFPALEGSEVVWQMTALAGKCAQMTARQNSQVVENPNKNEKCAQMLANDSKCPPPRARARPPSPSPSPVPTPTPSPARAMPESVSVIEKMIPMPKLPDKRVPTNGTPVQQLKTKLCIMYERPEDDPWSYEEEHHLANIAKRPNCLAEFEQLRGLRRGLGEKRFFPQKIARLLEDWTGQLDRARKAIKSPSIYQTK